MTAVISCFHIYRKIQKGIFCFQFFKNCSQYIFSSWGRSHHHVITDFSDKSFLYSCGQFIFRICHPAVGFRKYYIMEELYHCFTGGQNGYINYEQFKWVVCFGSWQEKAQVYGTLVVDDVMTNFPSWSYGYVRVVLFFENISWSTKVGSVVIFVPHFQMVQGANRRERERGREGEKIQWKIYNCLMQLVDTWVISVLLANVSLSVSKWEKRRKVLTRSKLWENKEKVEQE